MNSTHSSESILRLIVFNPESWIEKAEALNAASTELRTRVDQYWSTEPDKRLSLTPFLHAYFMMIGFAVENCLKSLVIMHQYDVLAEIFDRKKQLPELLRKHDLIYLFQQAGLTSSGIHTDALLRQLTRWTTWESRYPVPLDGDDYHKNDTFQLEGYVTASAFQSGDEENAARLMNGLLSMAKERTKKFQH